MFTIIVARLYASAVFATVGFTFPVVNSGLLKASAKEYRARYSSKGSGARTTVTFRLCLRFGFVENDPDALRLCVTRGEEGAGEGAGAETEAEAEDEPASLANRGAVGPTTRALLDRVGGGVCLAGEIRGLLGWGLQLGSSPKKLVEAATSVRLPWAIAGDNTEASLDACLHSTTSTAQR